MTDTHKHQKAWKIRHSPGEQLSLFETKQAGERFGHTRRMWAKLKVQMRRIWRHKFKRQTKLED